MTVNSRRELASWAQVVFFQDQVLHELIPLLLRIK